jgi:hypothetical protein
VLRGTQIPEYVLLGMFSGIYIPESTELVAVGPSPANGNLLKESGILQQSRSSADESFKCPIHIAAHDMNVGSGPCSSAVKIFGRFHSGSLSGVPFLDLQP